MIMTTDTPSVIELAGVLAKKSDLAGVGRR